jgi:monofunctional biosynthetic peptidoglycan transglycosylase
VIDESGYCAVRSEVSGLDFEKARGLVLDVMGDGHSYFIDLRMLWPLGPFGFYAAFHTMPKMRQKIYLPFSEFEPSYLGETLSSAPPLNPVQISSIGFMILDSTDGDFELKIRSIGTYK